MPGLQFCDFLLGFRGLWQEGSESIAGTKAFVHPRSKSITNFIKTSQDRRRDTDLLHWKYRTYIKGVGNETAVQQAYATETATLDELVMFEFSDASGMSYRTTDKVGVAAATGDGGEGSPIEIDPLGGSVGMFTPYITLSGGTYTPRYPDLIQPYDVSEPTGPDFSSLYATFGSRTADLTGFGTNWGSFAGLADQQIEEIMNNSLHGVGFHTNEELGGRPGARLTGFMTEFGEFQDYEQAQIHTEGMGDIIPVWETELDSEFQQKLNSADCIKALEVGGLKSSSDRNRALTNVIRDILGNHLFDPDTGVYHTGPVYPSAYRNNDTQNSNARPVLGDATFGNALLASMALVESSGGINMTQIGGKSNRKGGALGYFQIDRPDVGPDEALDVDWAITYTTYSMASELGRIKKAIPFDSEDPSLFVPIALTIHNSGGTRDDQPAIRSFVNSRNVSDLDKRTTDNYVQKVLGIRDNCF